MKRIAAVLLILSTSAFAQSQQGGNPPFNMEFIRIEPGTFQMGCSTGETFCPSNERPAHPVQISKAFEIGKYEVTQAQWKAVMESNPSRYIGDDQPVNGISWNAAQQFLERLNARNDGFHYRLPTEAEWEYAARASTAGPHAGDLDTIAWYLKNSGRAPFDPDAAGFRDMASWMKAVDANGNQTHPVGQKKPNAWGLYDVQGNVLEWVQDLFGEDYYRSSPASDPKGPATGEYGVLRGGAWSLPTESLRVSFRYTVPQSMSGDHLGFRCVREPAAQ